MTHRLRRLDQIRAARDASTQRAAQLASIEARLTDLSATVAREEQASARIETQLRACEISEALGEWIAARRQVVTQDEIESVVKAKQVARDKISQGLRDQVYRLAALSFTFIAAAAIAQSEWLLLGFLALAALTLIALAVRATTLWRELARASEELGQAQGEARARASAGEVQMARLKEAEAYLAQLNVAIPERPDIAQSRRDAIAREIGDKTKDELRADQDAARERSLNARAVLGELARQYAIQDTTDLQRERVACERATQKATAILSRQEPRVQAMADSLAVELDASAIQRARFQLDAQIEQAQRRVKEAARQGQEIARRGQQAQAFWERAREAYEKARLVKPDAPAWDLRLEIGDFNGFGKELRAEYDALGGETAVKQARQVEGELGRRQGERGTRALNATLLVARARELLDQIGQGDQLSAAAELEELEELGSGCRCWIWAMRQRCARSSANSSGACIH